jgi:3-oxoacyl-[acyl-carrier protein] reductase
VHGRDAAAVRDVTEEIAASGGRSIGVTAELTDFDAIVGMRDRIDADLGPVDVLVANAGGNIVRPGLVEEMTPDEWRDTVDANLTATFLTVKAFLPGMKERGRGTIITMSSAAARRPTAQSPAAYAAAKAGIQVLTRSLAIQAGPAGVRVNCLAPETILTERNEEQIPDDVKEQLRATHPIQRLGSPEDVADAALFLAGARSAWITGTVTDIAGGAVLA